MKIKVSELRRMVREVIESTSVPTAPCRACGGEGNVAGEFCAACGGTGAEVDPDAGGRSKGIGRGPLPRRL